MGFSSRLGQKIKAGLRFGAKIGAGALATAGAGYLAYKAHEHRDNLNKVSSDNLLSNTFAGVAVGDDEAYKAQIDAIIAQGSNTDLGPNYGQLNAPPPPPAFVPIGQRAIAGPASGNPSFGANVSGVGNRISGVGGAIQSSEQAVGKVKNFFKFGG